MDFFCESLRLQLIGELPEFVNIDTRPESKGMGERLPRGMASGRGGLADAGANYSIDRFLKGNAELARAASTAPRDNHRASESSACQVQRRTAPPVMPPSMTSSAPVM